MSKESRRKFLILALVSLAVLALDQWTKWIAVAELTNRFDGASSFSQRAGLFLSGVEDPGYDGYHFQPTRQVVVSDSFFRFRYAENPGAAFGMFRTLPENIRGPLFHLVTLGAVVLIFSYYRKLSGSDPRERWVLWGLPLVLGGALGNYVDRVARAFVIDFLEAHWMDKAAWPAFNIADAAICIGIGMLVVDGFVRKEAPKPSEEATA